MALRDTNPSIPATPSNPILNALEPEAAAEAAGLRYVTDRDPGFTRRRFGSGFAYLDPDGKRIRRGPHLERIESLRIPPAWKQVWICIRSDGHLQCTGRDDRGRKQYIYHERWIEIRNQTKFEKLLLFAEKLPSIRKRIEKDLGAPGLARERVLATIVAIMDKTMIRIGNEEYARANESFGLTTLRDQHVAIRGSRMKFRFKGKHGVQHEIELEDPRLARVVRRCQDLPGQELFLYEDDEGAFVPVGSEDVNSYLREISGEDITAKDFRTWGGSVLAARFLCAVTDCGSARKRKSAVLEALRETARGLGNTVAVCRKYYVHPVVLASFEAGLLAKEMSRLTKALKKARNKELDEHELLLQRLLSKAGTLISWP